MTGGEHGHPETRRLRHDARSEHGPRQVRHRRRKRARRAARAHARQGRRVRHRRHHARQVHVAREVPIGARQRLRLLRRRARLGLPGPALRQREVHRLAHRLSRCAGAHAAGHLPRRCRSRTTMLFFLGEFSRRRPRRSVRAACCGACSSAAARWASRPTPASSTSSSSSRRRRTRCARRTIRDLQADGARTGSATRVIRNSVWQRLLSRSCSTMCETMDFRSRACTRRPGRA